MSARPPGAKPKELVVLSGKGGTGKTSVVAALRVPGCPTPCSPIAMSTRRTCISCWLLSGSRRSRSSVRVIRPGSTRTAACHVRDCLPTLPVRAPSGLGPANGEDRDERLRRLYAADPTCVRGLRAVRAGVPGTRPSTRSNPAGASSSSPTPGYGPLVHARLCGRRRELRKAGGVS